MWGSSCLAYKATNTNDHIFHSSNLTKKKEEAKYRKIAVKQQQKQYHFDKQETNRKTN